MSAGKKKAAKKTAQVGVAAFALGLSLAGPQLGVASADSPVDTVASSAADAGSSAPAARNGAVRSKAGTAGRSDVAARSGIRRGAVPTEPSVPAQASVVPRASAAVAAPARRSSAKRADSAGSAPVPMVRAAVPDAGPASALGPTAAALAPVAAAGTAAAVSAVADQGPPSVAPVWARRAAVAERAYPGLFAAPGLIAAVGSHVNAEVVSLFHLVADLLAALPAGQLQTNLEGGLLLIRKKFFNQAPIATPVQLTTTAEGQILGTLAGRDPEGDAVTYTVLTNPQFGSIVVASDGHYTYTPGANYAGSDSFTVQVGCDGAGANILAPLGRV